MHPPTLAAFAEKFAPVGFRDTSFLPCYGLAEHVLAATFPPRGRRPRVERVSADDLTGRRVAVAHNDGGGASIALVSCGSALPGHRLQIVDEGGRVCAERQVGEIVLAGPSVMLGYYKQDALTAQTIRDGWLHTGDLGYLAGGELFVCGRAKDIIIVNGRKYHPAGSGMGGRRPSPASGAAAWSPSAPPPIGRADRVVIVAEPSGTVPADALTDAIRRGSATLFGLYVDDVAIVPSGTVGTHDERQGAARRDQGALRARRAGRRRPRAATAEAES